MPRIKQEHIISTDEKQAADPRDLTIGDLENIKDEVLLFLTGILDGMKNYYDQKLYKLPTTQ